MASGQYTKALELATAGGVLWTSGTIRVLLVDDRRAAVARRSTVRARLDDTRHERVCRGR